MVNLMFIRFVSGETDKDSHVSAGLFCAASRLRRSEALPDYEFDALTELKDWFNVHLVDRSRIVLNMLRLWGSGVSANNSMRSAAGKKQKRAQPANWESWTVRLNAPLVMRGAASMGSTPK